MYFFEQRRLIKIFDIVKCIHVPWVQILVFFRLYNEKMAIIWNRINRIKVFQSSWPSHNERHRLGWTSFLLDKKKLFGKNLRTNLRMLQKQQKWKPYNFSLMLNKTIFYQMFILLKKLQYFILNCKWNLYSLRCHFTYYIS